jgi:23S rRNA pseudouridine2604 synthase
MCDFLNYKVKKLERIRIMNIKLDVARGKWRKFSNNEINELKKLIS